MLRRTVAVLTTGAALTASSLPALSQVHDRAVLSVDKELRVAFDVLEGDARGLISRSSVVDDTCVWTDRQGVTPKFVVAFRGQAAELVQTDQFKGDAAEAVGYSQTSLMAYPSRGYAHIRPQARR